MAEQQLTLEDFEIDCLTITIRKKEGVKNGE